MGARIGIDLGTTNSAAATLYDDGPHTIPREDPAASLIPSVVYYRWQSGPDDVLVGGDADQQVGRVVRSVKRLMGRTYTEAILQQAHRYFPGGDVAIAKEVGNDLRVAITDAQGGVKLFWPHEVSAMILRHLRAHAERALGSPIDGAVITVPAYFEDPHRQATIEAARLAGLTIIEPLLDEPTAAALAYSQVVGIAAGEPLLVVDWGGGTLDVTVVVHDGNEWVQLAIDGDLNLGGDDVDRLLVEFMLTRRGLPLTLLDDGVALHKLLAIARTAKQSLSSGTEASVACGGLVHPQTGRPLMIAETITRSELERCIEPLVDRVAARVEACLAHPDVPPGVLKNILLVGGSTRIPALRRRLERLPGATLHDNIDPLSAVAIGAALYSAAQRPNVYRLCPYGYAIDAGGEMIEVIPPGQEVPTPAELPFRVTPEPRTRYDKQTMYRLVLHRFTRHDRHFRNLSTYGGARVFGRGLPPSPAGTPVGVELRLDENKVLHARVYPPGGGPPRDATVSMTEIGSEALSTQLRDRSLDAEALLEANTNNRTPLIQALEPALRGAQHSLETGSRDEASGALRELDDLLDQLRSAHEAGANQVNDGEVKARALQWLYYYEQVLLPQCWTLLDDQGRDAIVQDLRRIRIMADTGARGEEMWLALDVLRARTEAGPTGPILAAYARSATQGISARTREELLRLATEAANHWAAKRAAEFENASIALVEKVRAADQSWHAWHQSAGIERGDPTLLLTRSQEND